jgi:enamine deaminase RidA (YjgF/YER057c/UK114 family)
LPLSNHCFYIFALEFKVKKRMEIIRKDATDRMSRIVEHGNTIYLCGQTAKDANTDIKEQTKTTLEKVEDLLEKAGSDKKHILSVTIYVRDMKDFAAMNEVWDAWVEEGHQPARACVEARMARPELLVEMSVVAAKK